MRKTLSIILSAIMLLSVCSCFAMPASAAPEGTAINTADEFLAMVSTPADSAEPTAKYYLASDITLPSSYVEPFYGILDGNGHTVTVSNPMFNDFSGEVKNLTIKGEILYQDANAGALATLSSKAVTATNCVNYANVTVTGTGKWAAGFIADSEKTEKANIFINCVNNGNIYIDSVAKEKMRGGGFGGILDSCGFYNCTNNGNIYAKGNIPILGGFVGRIALNTPGVLCEAINCVNNGDVTVEETYLVLNEDGTTEPGGGGSDAGGIFGYIGGGKNVGWYRVWGCVNNGKIDAPYRAGGMIGYAWASKTDAYCDIQFCINNGEIVYGRTQKKTPETVVFDYGSPFVAYTNSNFTVIKHSINTATVTQRENTVGERIGNVFVGLSSCDVTVYDVQGIYDVHADQYKYYSHANPYSENGKYVGNTHEFSVATGIFKTSIEDIKSGKVCYDIMQGALADIYDSATCTDDSIAFAGFPMDYEFCFYQKIGTDEFPSIDPSKGWVVLNGSTYANGERPAETTEAPETTKEPEPETTPAPETTAAPDDGDATDAPAPEQTDAPANTEPAEKKGCGGFVAGSVAIVAILGTALIVEKRD